MKWVCPYGTCSTAEQHARWCKNFTEPSKSRNEVFFRA